jgi:hypothetical protein
MTAWGKVWAWIKEHKRTAVEILVAVLVFAAGADVGNHSQASKETDKTKVQEKQVTKQEVKQSTQVNATQQQDQKVQVHVHRVVVETKKPDGSQTKTITTDSGTDSETTEQKAVVKVQYVDRTVVQWKDRVVEKTVTKQVLKQPDWHVYAGLGLNLTHYLGQPDIGIPGLNGLVIQAGAERRILGPVWGGVFANTEGVVGLTVGGIF